MWEWPVTKRAEEGIEDQKTAQSIGNVRVPGENNEFNQELEALRVADFMEIGELMALDALIVVNLGRSFREEMQTEEGETKRDDENSAYVSAWEYTGDDQELTIIRNLFEI